MYWKEIAFICFGLFLGIAAGVYLSLSLLKDMIGDDYQIIKPKVKGTNNDLEVAQYNANNKETPVTEKKTGLIKRIFKRRKNG